MSAPWRSTSTTATAGVRPGLPAVVLGAVLALGCGGSSRPAPAQPQPEPEPPAEPEPPVIISDQKLEEIQHFFERKRTAISRCFIEALEAGELPREGGGRLTVSLTISESGAATNVTIAEMIPTSATLAACVKKNVSRWTITTLPRSLDYSYTYGFENL